MDICSQAIGHWAQAMAFVGLGETEQSWQQFLSASEFFVNWGWDARATWILPVLGIILARQGRPERAVEILSLYFNHPNRPIGFAEGWPLLSEWQARLQESLGPEGFRAAWERGRELDLVAAIGGYLDERE